MEWKKKTTGVWKCEFTSDLTGIVSWHLMKRDFTKISTGNLKRGLHQLLKPSQNQYRWQGTVQGDETRKYFFSDNQILVQKLTANHAKQILKNRIASYTKILNSMNNVLNNY
jgi:hypothetical protein